MIPTQDITFGVASQTLILDCEDGPITSVSDVDVYEATADDTSTADAATTGAASVDSTATTLNAAATAESTSLTLLSGTGFVVGRRYKLLGADGLNELIEIAARNGTAVTCRSPLKNAYASGVGSSLTATRATITVDTSWASDVSNASAAWDPNPRYRVRWLVVVAGETRVYERYFDLVRYPARHGVTPSDVEDRFPGFLDTLGVDRQVDQGRSYIERAFRQLRMDLWQDGKSRVAMRLPEIVGELVIARAWLLKIEDAIAAGGEVDERRIKSVRDVYAQRYDGIVRAPFVAVDASGGGGAAVKNTPTPVWRR